jgi:hypothetical protein
MLLVKVIIARRDDCKVLEVKHKCEQEKHGVQTAMRLYKYRIRLNGVIDTNWFPLVPVYFERVMKVGDTLRQE